MTRLLLVLFFFSGIVSLVAAQSFNAGNFLDNAFEENGTLTPDMQAQLGFASQQFQELPSPIQAIFGNQRIAVQFTRNNGTVENLGVVLTNNTITSFTRYPPANATMNVSTDEETAMRIASSGNISEAIVEAVNAGELQYDATPGGGGEFAVFMANITVWLATIMNAILSIFGMS